jgi:hypothetical protein
MLFWLEEAAIEIVMILAVAVGVFMFVAAVASLIHDRLRIRERRNARPTVLRSARPARHTRPAGDHVWATTPEPRP